MEMLVKKIIIEQQQNPCCHKFSKGRGRRREVGGGEGRTQPAKKSIQRNVLLPPRFTAMPFHPESSVLFSFSLSLKVLQHYHVMLLNVTKGFSKSPHGPQA